MSENKEEILANFQSISGIEDVGEAFSVLEETNWDLMTAIQRVIPQEDRDLNIPPPPPTVNLTTRSDVPPLIPISLPYPSVRSNILNNFSSTSAGTQPSTSSRFSNSNNHVSNNHAVASSSRATDYIDLTSIADLDGIAGSSNGNIIFNIHFNQQVHTLLLPSHATVENLKNQIASITQVPNCRQAIRGWPQAALQDAQNPSTRLCNLGLGKENELIMIDLTDEGYMDYSNDEVTKRLEKTFNLNIVQQPSGKAETLNFSGNTTIEEVKNKTYYVTDIPVRHQEWTGWPSGCDNKTTLAQSRIELNHNFVVRNAAENQPRNNSQPSANAVALDTDSSADEFEDASDFNPCEEYFTDSPPAQTPSRHLIANNTDDEISGTIQFIENYAKRFGEPHPNFFRGTLENALKEACHRPARERKLLALYLHHGESILANVFCDQLMKHESIRDTFARSFVLYGWDITYESNKHLFLSLVTACVSNTATLTVRNIPLDKLPAILVIGKSRLSGRTTCEVLSVIHGNVGLDDLLSRLLEVVEVYNEHLQVEVREEEEREARDQVKAEQDMAYQQTLQADMAKDAAKRQQEAAAEAERQRLASLKADEEARRESIRFVAEQSLPEEPADTDANITKVRVRKPTGDFMERRFYMKNTLQDLLNFVAANGFIIEDYKVISSWPRRDLTNIDASQTFQSLNMHPQETVILEER